MTRSDRLALVALGLLAGLLACRRAEPVGPPNILLVVWDTVRADRLSLYGHTRETTPRLAAFARDARVFEDCISVGSTTGPAHASIFTGLLPAEHGISNQRAQLADGFVTLAEALRGAGYRTFLFSENPHLGEDTGLTQGFEVAEYPWSPAHRGEAITIIRAKLAPEDRSNELALQLSSGRIEPSSLVATAPLPEKALSGWLEREKGRPFFAVLNYMEAHQPLIPSRAARAKMMTPEQVAASYRVDRRWAALWDFTFGLRDYSDGDLELTGLTYDAALYELDGWLGELLESLRARGALENTVVAVVGDHGEHLGEKHRLDHQFSVYEPLLRVPLVLWYPPRVAAGRESSPVTNMDLFPTLLELAGVPVPTDSTAASLLAPASARIRVGAYPAATKGILDQARKRHPSFDPAPFERTLQAVYRGTWKLIVGSDGRRELYDLARDPSEEHDLAAQRADDVISLAGDLQQLLAAARMAPHEPTRVQPDGDTRARLEALGYVDDPAEAPANP